MEKVRVRIAPSPTGQDLHIGNAYTALINYAVARKYKGKFIIRIEDTDRTRFVAGSEGRILSSLNWLGLEHDEGPDIPGDKGPYRQSERLEYYRKYAEELVSRGMAYYCFCTSDRLEQMRKSQQARGLPPMYDGMCRNLDLKLSREKITGGEKYTVRLKVNKEGKTAFTDLIRGTIEFENRLIDDQVILKSDGFPTYHLGVVVDDHLMEISHVIRGEEWISSTPKHIILYQSFGWKLPVFAHLPLLRNPDKSKLSKRKNPVWVSWYREQGFLPEALLNYLAQMGWSHPEGKDIFSLEEFIEKFSLERIQTSGPVFDINKLKWINEQKLNLLGTEEYSKLINLNSIYHPPVEMLTPIVPLVKPRIKVISEYDSLAGFFHSQPHSFEINLQPFRDLLGKIIETLDKLGNDRWKAEIIGGKLAELAGDLKLKNSEFFMVLRVALTGKKISPPLNESLEILGREKVLNYLNNAFNNNDKTSDRNQK